MSIIAVCTSASMYTQALQAEAVLKARGHQVILPATVNKMEQSGNFEVAHYKTWFHNDADYQEKAALMRGHFTEIEKADVILILNYEKNGKANYIGGNVLIEMALAFYLHKPLYVLNDLPADSPYYEEIAGMLPTVLHGDLSLIT